MPRSNSDLGFTSLAEWFENNLTLQQKEDLIFLMSEGPQSVYGPFGITEALDPSAGVAEAGSDSGSSGGITITGNGIFVIAFGGFNITTSAQEIGIVPSSLLSGAAHDFIMPVACTVQGSVGISWSGLSGASSLTIAFRVNGSPVQTITPSIGGASGSTTAVISNISLAANDSFTINVSANAGTISTVNITALGTT